MFKIKSIELVDCQMEHSSELSDAMVFVIENENMKLRISEKFGLQFLSTHKENGNSRLPIFPHSANQIDIGLTGELKITRVNSIRNLELPFKRIVLIDEVEYDEYVIEKVNDMLHVTRMSGSLNINPNTGNCFTIG